MRLNVSTRFHKTKQNWIDICSTYVDLQWNWVAMTDLAENQTEHQLKSNFLPIGEFYWQNYSVITKLKHLSCEFF